MKNKFIAFIQSVKAAMAEITTRANEQIAAMPPVEQHEASGMILSMKRELSWLISRAEDLSNSEIVTQADQIMAEFSKEVLNDAITAGSILAKETHESLIEASRDGGIIAGRQQAQLIASRRSEIDTVLGEKHGITIEDEKLLGEGYTTFLTSIQEAVTAASESGFTLQSSPKGWASIISAALSGKGKEEVTSIIACLAEVRGSATPATSQTNEQKTPAQGAIIASAKEEGSKPFSFKKPY